MSAPTTITAFEKEFGVKVRYATYENNEELFGKIMSGNSGWDVVFPTHNRIDPLRALAEFLQDPAIAPGEAELAI